jgi:hypothetical protein
MLLFGLTGLTFILLGLLSGSYLFYQALLGQSISLRPLTLVAVFLVVTGVQFLSLGLISEMLLGVKDDIDSVKIRTDRNRSKNVDEQTLSAPP